MRDFSDDLRSISTRVDEAAVYLRVDESRQRMAELEAESSRPDLWDDQDRARKITGELSQVTDDVKLVDSMMERVADLKTLAELAREEGDESFEPEIADGLIELTAELDRLELRALFTGEYDERDAIVEINSGAGGTDAADWAEMMLRMYTRWAERRGFAVEIEQIREGEEAGISSATFTVKGRYAYGLLRAERGVHRLVRISPFDGNARRQTSFASLDLVPVLDESEAPEIEDKDLRVDTYRSSGAGGQHVNKTDSAVRLTHLPTGVVVAVQNERSQTQNKAKAMQILGARLAELHRQEQADQLASIQGTKSDVGWGSQIRSYVLAPYQLVKDLRTDWETGNVSAVLDGDLDPVMEAYLQWQRAEGAGTA